MPYYKIMDICVCFATLSIVNELISSIFFCYLCAVGHVQQLVNDPSSDRYIFRCELFRYRSEDLSSGCLLLEFSWVLNLLGCRVGQGLLIFNFNCLKQTTFHIH